MLALILTQTREPNFNYKVVQHTELINFYCIYLEL